MTEPPSEALNRPSAQTVERSSETTDPRTLASEEILQGRDEVRIVHENQVYRLRRTRNGKLILQK